MAEYITNAGNTNRFKFAEKFVSTNKVVGLARSSQIFVPMVFSLDLPGVSNPPPPLILYITPSDISIQRRKALTEHYLRSGPIREEWGNELDVWNCSGWIAAFYKNITSEIDFTLPTPAAKNLNPVLTQINRDDTAGYQNFVSLLSFYKNNGRTYYDRGVNNDSQRNQLGFSENGKQIIDNRPFLNKTEVAYVNVEENGSQSRLPVQARMPRSGETSLEFRNRVRKSIRDNSVARISTNKNTLTRPSRQIRHVGSVIIAYDMRLLLGHFETFEWTESVDNPYQIKYSFSFVVKAQYDMAAKWTGQGTVRG